MEEESGGTAADGKPSNSSGRLVLGVLLGLAIGVAVGMFAGQPWHRVSGDSVAQAGVGVEDKGAEEEIRRLYDREHENLLSMDIEAQARFLPDDFVVTNPFNMFIDKQQVIKEGTSRPGRPVHTRL